MVRSLFDPTEGPAIIRFPGIEDATNEPTGTGSVPLEEIDALYRAADAADWPILKGRKRDGREHLKPADWWRCWLVLWDTGERITAIISLEWIDVDLNAGYIRCRAENRKGGRRDRGYTLHPDTVEALRAIHQPECRHVLEWPYCRNYLWRRYGKLLAGAGLPNDRQHKFHCVRKSVASYFEAAGGNATELLGHSSRSVTRKYIDPKISRPPQAVDLLFRPDAAAGACLQAGKAGG